MSLISIRCMLLTTILFLSGCATMIETYPTPEIALPDTFLTESGTSEFDSSRWWETFNSEELNSIEEKALASLFSDDKRSGNFDLQIAYTRLTQSAANLSQSRSSFFPQLDYRGSTGRTFEDSEGSNNSSYSDSFSGSLSLSYELDLWGKVAAASQADEFRYQVSYEDMLTTVLTVSSSVANTYIDILSTRAEIQILKDQVELNTTLLELQRTRYGFGQSSGLDVLQQQEQLVSSQSEEPILIERERAYMASLALLTGELPTYQIELTEKELPTLPPLPATGIPAELLENRPDIRAAKYELLAADKDLAIANLAYFPSINLSVSEAISSAALSVLLNDWTTSLLASITGVIFDGGSKLAEMDRKDAAAQEAAINYIKTVATALGEVNTALMAEQAQIKYLENLAEQFRLQKAAEKEAQISYLNGGDTFLRYITQLQSLQSLEKTILREKTELLKLRINLYKSLGITI